MCEVKSILTGLNVLREYGADTIVAVGGGSPVDAAKAVIYFLQKETGGAFVRLIAIPTTLTAAGASDIPASETAWTG